MNKWVVVFLFFLLQLQIFAEDMNSKIDSLLKKMTLEEKIGQMTQITLDHICDKKGDNKFEVSDKKLAEAVKKYHVGSFLNVAGDPYTVKEWNKIIKKIQSYVLKNERLKIPMIYGIDAIHGANYIVGSTIFPHSIAMAATWNKDLVRKDAEITALEIRAAGIPWNFNPVLGVGRNPVWSRLFETFGEDPYAVSVYGVEYVKGLQGEITEYLAKDRALACMKHYLGYSFPLSGHDRTPAWIPERQLREYFLPPFAEAVKAGCLTVMVNSAHINGIPVHANKYILTDILKKELGFKGFIVTDWADIKNLFKRDHVAKDYKEAVKMAINAGIDMSMVPDDYDFCKYLKELVEEGSVPMERIDDAVRRILYVKMVAGLFENPFFDKKLAKKVGKKEFDEVSLQAAEEAITLLKNEKHILPLKKGSKILVTGPTSNSMARLNGGWSYTWQGDREDLYPEDKFTVYEAIVNTYGKDNVIFSEGCDYDKDINIDETVDKAKDVDVIVACLGEKTYCETVGNIDDLSLPSIQYRLVKELRKLGKPIVGILIEGRPRIIKDIVDDLDAIMMAYLPGNNGGKAIANILSGKVSPSGKLPITYPKYPNDLKCYDVTYSEDREDKLNKYDPQFPFGFGLSYTSFEYSNLKIDKDTLTGTDTLHVYVDIANTGDVIAKEAVLLYLSDEVASIIPSKRRLKGFEKIELKPGEKKRVSFSITKDKLSFIGLDLEPVVEEGFFKITVGNLTKRFYYREGK